MNLSSNRKKLYKFITINNFLKLELSQFNPSKKSNPIFNLEDYWWIAPVENVIKNIQTIVNHPRTHLIANKEFKIIEATSSINNDTLLETQKRAKYWRKKDGDVLPEKIVANEFDINYAIYENRFIITLINKLMTFVNFKIRQLLSEVDYVSKNFHNKHINFNDFKYIGDLSNIESSKYNFQKVFYKKHFLTIEEEKFTETLIKLFNIKRDISHLINSKFYVIVKAAKPLSEIDIKPTNILLSDPTYSPCYRFYLELKKTRGKHYEIPQTFSLIDYSDYVLNCLIKNLIKTGYKFKSQKLKLIKNHIKLSKTVCTNKRFKLKISNSGPNITLEYTLSLNNKKFIKQEYLENKKTNKILLILVPIITNNFDSIVAKNKLTSKKYNNIFYITTYTKEDNNSIVLCSPYYKIFDSNISNMLDSFTAVTEASGPIYTHLCPICGNIITVNEDKGNYSCPYCDSIYSIIKTKSKLSTFNTLWIKKIGLY